MFKKILSSARNIVPFSKPDKTSTSEKKSPAGRSSRKSSAPSPTTMVTTRRQSGALSSQLDSATKIDDEHTPKELLSESAKKRRRASTELKKAGDDEDTTTPTKRRRLPVRNKGENSPAVLSNIAVEIPAMEESEKVVTETVSTPRPTRTTPRTRQRKKAEEAVEEKEQAETDKIAVKSSPVSKPSPGGKANFAVVVPLVPATPLAKPKHKKFDDNEPIEVAIDEQPTAEKSEDDEDESSDDDAPEEVGAQAAQDEAKSSARDAARAAEQKEAAERQKRKDRDAQLKAQAQAAKKRKHTDEAPESVTVDNDSTIAAEPALRSSKNRIDRSTLPDLLPEDLLEDSDSDESMVSVEDEPRQSKKIKFAYPEEKKTKDKKRGLVTYRVAQGEKEGFAPKASQNARSAKAALQGGRKGQVRNPVSKGFVVAKRSRA